MAFFVGGGGGIDDPHVPVDGTMNITGGLAVSGLFTAFGFVNHRFGNLQFNDDMISRVGGAAIRFANNGIFNFTSDDLDDAVAEGYRFGVNSQLDKDSFTAGAMHSVWIDGGTDRIMTLTPAGDLMTLGDFEHAGANLGFYGTTPAAQSAAYSRAATIVEDRALLASASATATNNNNVLAALIADLQAIGLIG